MNHRGDSLKKNLVEISKKPLKSKKGWLLSHGLATSTGVDSPTRGSVVFHGLRFVLQLLDNLIAHMSTSVLVRG
jgi:hypothetical protein